MSSLFSAFLPFEACLIIQPTYSTLTTCVLKFCINHVALMGSRVVICCLVLVVASGGLGRHDFLADKRHVLISVWGKQSASKDGSTAFLLVLVCYHDFLCDWLNQFHSDLFGPQPRASPLRVYFCQACFQNLPALLSLHRPFVRFSGRKHSMSS
jgi:hypothetical protein